VKSNLSFILSTLLFLFLFEVCNKLLAQNLAGSGSFVGITNVRGEAIKPTKKTDSLFLGRAKFSYSIDSLNLRAEGTYWYYSDTLNFTTTNQQIHFDLIGSNRGLTPHSHYKKELFIIISCDPFQSNIMLIKQIKRGISPFGFFYSFSAYLYALEKDEKKLSNFAFIKVNSIPCNNT
jgi:hypothetical protein